MRGIVELLSTETRNSAFHATRLDVDHVASVVESLVASAERRFGVDRTAMAPETVFVSHETYTPARGGSAAAEITALREVFGAAADRVIVANTKGFTGHPMGVGIEDVIGVKILEHQIVPPVPNLKEPDPDLGPLTLSKGGRYEVEYAIHLAAGFGSQIALTLTRRIPGGLDRVDDRARYAAVAGRRERPRRRRDRGREARRCASPASGARPRARARARGGSGSGRCGASSAPGGRGAPDGDRRRRRCRLFAPHGHAGLRGPRCDGPAQTAPTALPRRAARCRRPRPPGTPPRGRARRGAGAKLRRRGRRREKVLAIVAEKTGYPPDMLDMDLDLEADLGVDTVKQAETFAAVREAYGIAAAGEPEAARLPDARSTWSSSSTTSSGRT